LKLNYSANYSGRWAALGPIGQVWGAIPKCRNVIYFMFVVLEFNFTTMSWS
jgi:hypothetical protein